MTNFTNSAEIYFKEGFSCSQAVLAAFADQFGLDKELALKISSAFGGGMARTANTCGAVTGALMVVGLKYGRTQAEDKDAKEKVYRLSQEIIDQFIFRNDSIICKELIGLDISTPDAHKLAMDNKIFETSCAFFVKDAIEILEKIV